MRDIEASRAVTLSCKHVFHRECIRRTLSFEHGGKCPICRQVYFQTTPDLYAPCGASKVMRYGPRIDITVADAPGGVVVRKVGHCMLQSSVAAGGAATRACAAGGGLCAAAGLRAGDGITHLNGIPCLSAKHCIAVIDAADTHEADVVCSLQPSRCRLCLFAWLGRRP